MIMRVTARLGKRIGHVPAQVLPPASNPFTDWSAHVFPAGRTQYIIIANTVSLYSVLMHGEGVTDNSVFLKRAMASLLDTLRSDGFGFIFERLIVPDAFKVFLSKSLNRSVTGSMGDLVYQAKCCFGRESITPFEMSFRLNGTPLSRLGHKSPREAFHRLKIS